MCLAPEERAYVGLLKKNLINSPALVSILHTTNFRWVVRLRPLSPFPYRVSSLSSFDITKRKKKVIIIIMGFLIKMMSLAHVNAFLN